jgi:DNA sulfur modification protein DndB
MANKTIVPAFRAKVGTWDYYICIMKYAEVARSVRFAHELGSGRNLNDMIQRGLTDRSNDIVNYLLESPHRFLGALLVAVWGGEPDYQPLAMEDSDGILSGIDRQFGVITFDGGQQYFALDGQHRLRAIQQAVVKDPNLGKEEICVMLVPHFDTENGRKQTRRLFTNINRNAKSTSLSENIALDEDDGSAILTRRLVVDHPILRSEGFVKIFAKPQNNEGNVKLAGLNIPIGEPKAFTTIGVLYDMVRSLSFGLPKSVREQGARPSAEDLDDAYSELEKRFCLLFGAYSSLVDRLIKQGEHARSVRVPRGVEGDGHHFMRPVIQRSICKTIGRLCDQRVLMFDEAIRILGTLPVEIKHPPWSAVFNVASKKMISAKENANLLELLLYMHIAPPSKRAIQDARKEYKNLKNEPYPIDDATMFRQIRAHEVVTEEGAASMSDALDSGN